MSERPSTSGPALLELGDAKPAPELVRTVRDALAGGALIGLPTETVYGLAARADRPEALAALRAAKGRPADVPLTWHVGDRTPLEQFAFPRAVVGRLAERYWPGPLTLVLEGVPPGLEAVARDGRTGVRCPAHSATAALLAACDFPVVATSANLHGEAPATSATEVAARFGSALALVLDGGPARLSEASGVLLVARGRFELLREGLLSLEELRRTAGLRIAFVCTGNTCRSPMAEALARQLIGEALGRPGGSPARIADFGFEVGSMGLFAADGAPASGGALSVLAAEGIDLAPHRSRPAVPELLLGQDRVYALTQSHLDGLRLKLPPARGPRLQLLDPAGRDIADPIGGGPEVYRACADQIRAALRQRLAEWV
jgi:L-threonylcarbamoyladenylate synthase